uniref:Peptidase M12B domain-containing protein n=1 Tax=Globodera rostochiensis TaxID=31243 RepID=A0A914HEV8_GLORO
MCYFYLLPIVVLIPFAEVLSESVQLVEMVDLDNIVFTKSVRFVDNGTLAEDVQVLDKLYSKETAQRKEKREQHPKRGTANDRRTPQRQRLEARILMVGDHSLHETFLKLYREDEYAAYTALSRYLLGVFTQLETIFGRLSFLSADSSLPHQILFQLAGPPMVIVRPEDCPLRGPMLIALEQNAVNASTASETAAVGNVFNPDNATTATIRNEQLSENDDGLEKALAAGIEGWNRMDGLRAVQWTHRWVEHSEGLLPEHDHVMVLTRMDLISQRNDSATQGMAYVRAICRGADSVSVGREVIRFGGVEAGTATVAAHELSHSLGAFHDGSDANINCSSRQNFLMAPISASHTFSAEFGDTFPNAFVLSDCSKRQIEQFLSSAESNCLWRKSTLVKRPSTSADLPKSPNPNSVLLMKKRPMNHRRVLGRASGGQRWLVVGTANPGSSSTPANSVKSYSAANTRRDFMLLNSDPCRRLWCKNRQQRRWAPCETKGFLPMMDGTRCGEGKWCVRGVCTIKAKLSKRSEHQQLNDDSFGDELSDDGEYFGCRDLNPSFCSSFGSELLRSFCHVLNFSRICCASCRPIQRRRL